MNFHKEPQGLVLKLRHDASIGKKPNANQQNQDSFADLFILSRHLFAVEKMPDLINCSWQTASVDPSKDYLPDVDAIRGEINYFLLAFPETSFQSGFKIS